MNVLLELRGVVKDYGSVRVIDHVDLQVEPHSVVSLIGASGSGKSTLLRCLNGLEEIQEGEVVLDDEVVSGSGVDYVALRRRIGMVFQSYNLFRHMSVLRNCTVAPVTTGLCDRHEAEERSLEMLDRVGMRAKAASFPDQLSGGQQQRVAIARAMLMRPKVLLLDEITSALDPELVLEVLDLVRDLARQGMTMLLTTHEMSFAREISNLVCFLHNGRILEQGPPEKIFGAPEHPATKSFLRNIPGARRP
jgi:polar amino acid transport system ATP-binding protein